MPPSKLVKALLLNIFVIPGSGELIIFKRKKRGLILITTALGLVAALFFHLTNLIQTQLTALGPPSHDFAQMYQLARIASRGIIAQNWPILRLYLLGLLACYLTGIGDVIWLFRQKWRDSSLPKTPAGS